ncbi:MAG: hypothetical protein KDK30_18230, partial [Leptospiraceae bacterium]|nr:hypothetical protein [Leptospiraceae bacterium]
MSALVLSVWVTVLALGHWLLAVSRRPAMHIEYLDRPEYDLDVLRIGYLHVINDRDHQARVPLPEFTADWRNNPGSTPLAVRLYSPVANGRITPLPSSLSLAAREEVR